MPKALLTALLVISLTTPSFASPSAEEATCQSGPAADASIDRPHLVDPLGDVNRPQASALPGGDGAYDIVRAWVSQVDAPPPNQPATFNVNVAVARLAEHPVNAIFYIDYSGTEWVSAKALLDGNWEFRWGVQPAIVPVIGAVRQSRGEVPGQVDPATGIISIQLPARLPAPRLDGREITLDRLFVRSGSALAAPLSIGDGGVPEVLLTTDTTSNAETCTVVLYSRVENVE